MNDIKNKDLYKGFKNEDKVFEYLKNNKYPKIKKSKRQYAIFDFKVKKLKIEVKSRNCFSNSYETTMVGFNKIRHLEKYDYKGEFYFLFEDGLYCWEYNSAEYHTRLGGRTDRGSREIKEYAYIKKEYLKLITGDITSSVCLIDF
tara:strand:+ start:792 stop:1226 length:435 start_codon:yes stop_codon:yes gene_type:complete